MSVSITLVVVSLLDPLLKSLGTLTATLISTAVFAPFVEEFSKVFPLYYRHGETQHSILNLAIMVGLGFAIVELLEYVFLLGTPVFDRLPGLIFHPSNTVIAAYGIATRKTVPFYLLAVSLHFGANFLAIVFPLLSVLAVVLTVFLAYVFYSRTKERMIPS
jgi:RsiW-degrading membrane proteinase PrsW (M82 family)